MVQRLDELVTEELFGGPKEPTFLGALNRNMWLSVRNQNSHHSLPCMPAAVFKGAHLKINFLDWVKLGDSILMILPEARSADPDGIIILSLKCCCSQFETDLNCSGKLLKFMVLSGLIPIKRRLF